MSNLFNKVFLEENKLINSSASWRRNKALSIDRKILDKIQHTFMIKKKSKKTKNKGKLPQLDKEYIQKPIACIIFNDE